MNGLALEALYIRLRLDVAMGEIVEKLVVDDGMGLEDPMIRRLKAEPGEVAIQHLEHEAEDALFQPHR